MRSHSKLLPVLALSCALSARAQPAGEAPRSYALSEAPAEWAPALKAADEAMQALQSRLLSRLTTELARVGAARAVDVCRVEAQAMTDSVREERGFDLGRTSRRLRSPKNAPRPWVEPFLASAEGKKAREVSAVAVDLGEHIGVLKPIPVKGLCLQCHGRKEVLSPRLRRTLRERYPEDQGTGFAEGDLRGFLWAELAKPDIRTGPP